MGAERICQQLGYERGIRGPRNANPEGSGPVHALSGMLSWIEGGACPHNIDQGVICSGGILKLWSVKKTEKTSIEEHRKNCETALLKL